MPERGPRAAYSAAFLDHLERPRAQGTLEGATHRGEATDATCGDRLSLDLVVDDGVVRDARFRVEGCPGAIAVGSALASLLPGRRAGIACVGPDELERALGGVPPAKRHALRLATATLSAALASLRGRSGRG
jgi:nitrogen fixation NifU-like protein